jgi:spore cortex formation protein SpoVR/YcgB (stage V sporulation)
MKLDELEILEDDFDLFVALDDTDKIEFLFDATEHGTEVAVVKHVAKLADKYMPPKPIISSEDFSVGSYRLCITTFQNSEIYLNSNSLKAIRQFVNKLFNDGVLLWPIDKKKTEFDIYRFFKAYKIIGRTDPFCSN